MGILDDAEHAVSAVINGAESIASDMESLVEHAVSELESLGISTFGSVSWLVKHLIELGEDPVYIISRLIAHITSIGGDTASTLEEIAQGIMTYGLMGFLKRKVEQALAPLQETLQKSIMQGQAIAAVHRTTLSTMQSQLETLKTGVGSPDMAWQGQSVEAMSASFDSISKVINELSDQIAHDGTQAALNRACLMALEGIAIIATGLAIIDALLLIASAVVVVATDGLGAIVVAPIDAAAIAGQIELILTLVAADLLAWLLGTLAIYVIHHPLAIYTISYPWNPSTTTTGTSTATNGIVFSVKKETPDGRTIGVRPLKSREVKNLKTSDGTRFEKEKGKMGYPPKAEIYVDQDGNYWIGMPGSNYVEPFP